jgi:hypothetical protein
VPLDGLYVRTAVGPSVVANGKSASIWIVGELDARLRRETAWSSGAVADLTLVAANGDIVARRTIDVSTSEMAFFVRLPETGNVSPGEYAARLDVRPSDGRSGALSASTRVVVAAEPARLGEAILWRRGPSTGPRFVVTADARFRRSDRLRVEHTSNVSGAASARMLDRLGRAMQVPVTIADRVDAAGAMKWTVAEAVLAPLAPGDYAIEVTMGDSTATTAFKVVP